MEAKTGNPWLKHVKAYQAKHNCSYKDALKGAKATYKKGTQGGSLSSMNKAYWRANKDLFNATYPAMSAAATKLYGF